MLLDDITIIISSLYSILFIVLIIGWIRIKPFNKIEKEFSSKVSILVPARNEEPNIRQCLEDIQKQNYPKDLLEVIIIDDHSFDNTAEIINLFISEETGMQVQLLQLQDQEGKSDQFGKKTAITIGIENANGDIIITTDADCRINEEWLASIVSCFEKNRAKLVSAPVSFHNENPKPGIHWANRSGCSLDSKQNAQYVQWCQFSL